MERKELSILMYPWLAHGHIFPFLELAKTLSKRSFTIHFCSTSINLDSIKTNISKDPSIVEGSIKLVQLEIESPQLPPKLHTSKNLPSHLMPTLIQDYQKSSSSFTNIFDSLKPDLLIFDFFQPWAAKHALSNGTPSVYFVTSGATACSFYHHDHTHKTSCTFPYHGIYLLDQEKVEFGGLSMLIKDADHDSYAFGNFNLSSEIVLLKTSKGLERKYVDYLSILCGKQIVPTGPLVVRSEEDVDSEIMTWLNEKDECSTVYVSFGSECFLSKEQIDELAKGLELCNVNFIWIIRFPEGENIMTTENALPQGFLERVKGRGMVVWKFAPQTRILEHKSIGGFVSHCGWSSVMESVYFGVPVIAMPMKFDQPVNCRMVVEAGVGVEVGKDMNGLYFGEEVARAISKVIADKEFGEGMRYNTKIMSDTIKGNEERDGNEVAEQLMSLCKKNRMQQM